MVKVHSNKDGGVSVFLFYPTQDILVSCRSISSVRARANKINGEPDAESIIYDDDDAIIKGFMKTHAVKTHQSISGYSKTISNSIIVADTVTITDIVGLVLFERGKIYAGNYFCLEDTDVTPGDNDYYVKLTSLEDADALEAMKGVYVMLDVTSQWDKNMAEWLDDSFKKAIQDGMLFEWYRMNSREQEAMYWGESQSISFSEVRSAVFRTIKPVRRQLPPI